MLICSQLVVLFFLIKLSHINEIIKVFEAGPPPRMLLRLSTVAQIRQTDRGPYWLMFYLVKPGSPSSSPLLILS